MNFKLWKNIHELKIEPLTGNLKELASELLNASFRWMIEGSNMFQFKTLF